MITRITGGLVYDVRTGKSKPEDIIVKDGRIEKLVVRGVKKPGAADTAARGAQKAGTPGAASRKSAEETILDVAGATIYPGFIDAHSHMGMWTDKHLGNDANECSNPISPGVRAIDGVNPLSPDIAQVRSAGFTAVMITPGSGDVVCGQAAVAKLAGERDFLTVLDPYAALKAALGENPISVFAPVGKAPCNRMSTASLLDETLGKAAEYCAGKKTKTTRSSYWEIFRPVFERRIPLKVHCHRADDILTAIRIAEKHKLRLTLDHCTEGYRVLDELAGRKIPVLLGPLFMVQAKAETSRSRVENVLELAARGCDISLISDHPFENARYLAAHAGLLVRAGLPAADALRMLTINPARALGYGSELGSIEAGKAADFAVYDGSPLEVRSRCVMTIIDGRVVHSDAETR